MAKEINEAIQKCEALLNGFSTATKTEITSNVVGLADLIEKSKEDKSLWSESDSKNFNTFMKYILTAIENQDFGFGAMVVGERLKLLLDSINYKARVNNNNKEFTDMDEVTGKIQAQYNGFAYPNYWKGKVPSDIREFVKNMIVTGLYNLDYIQKRAFKKYIPLDKFTVLIAGCGTGEDAIIVAMAYPMVKFTFVDISPISLSFARQYVKELNLANVNVFQENIMTMKLNKKYDLIVSVGVIHHLSDPAKGVKNLKDHLYDHGVLSAMVYGKYGRFEIGLFQDALKTILGSDFSMELGVNTAKQFVADIDASRNRMTNIAWKEDLNRGDNHIVDLLLNENEFRYTVDSLSEMLNLGGMQLLEMISHNTYDPFNYVKNEGLRAKIQELSYLEKCKLAELINGKISKHNFYALKSENDFKAISLENEYCLDYVLCKSPFLIVKTILSGERRDIYISLNIMCVFEEVNVAEQEIQIDDVLLNFLNLCNGKIKLKNIFDKLDGTINVSQAENFIRDMLKRKILFLAQ